MTHDVLPFRNINEVIRATEYSSVKAIENADIFTAIKAISDDVSSLPIQVLDSLFEHNNELEYLLNVEPNNVMSGRNLIATIVTNAILNGNSYILIERDDSGHPIGLHYLPNNRVVSIKKKSNSNYNTEIIYEIRSLNKENSTKTVSSDDILHIKLFSLDGITGRSPLIALKDDIETQSNSKKFYNQFFKFGTTSSGVIKVAGDLNADDKEAVRQAFHQQNSSIDNAHKIIVLDESTEFQPIQIDTNILKLINESKYSTQQVAKVMGLPLSKLGIETHSQSLEQASADYLINTLSNYISVIESELNRKIFKDKALRMNNKITFNTDMYKYVDAKTKYESIRAQIEMGAITINEGRQLMDLEPLEKDVRLQSLNFINAELADTYQLERVKNVQKNIVDENELSEPSEGGEFNE